MKKKLKSSSILALTLSILFSIMSPSSGHTLSLPNQDNPAAESYESSDIYLYVGSPLILSQDKISPLDPENLDVAATVIDNRTLVPLRALSEYFKADVSYNAEQRKAIINYNGKQYIFPIGEKKYIIKDKSSENEVLLDTKTSILNQRTMVPLKVICEDILGRKVSYYNKIIAIGNTEINLKENKKLADSIKQKIGAAVKATSLDQIKAVMSQSDIRLDNIFIAFSEAAELEVSKAAADASVSNSPLSDTANSSSDYSTTNTQVQGIDEADIVKTDGKYIYIAGNNAVRIVSTDSNGTLKESAIIKLPQNKTVAEIYIDENRLVLIGNRYETQNSTIPEQKTKASPAIENEFIATTDIAPDAKLYIPYRYKNYSFVDVYDTSDHQNPKFIKGHEMEGSYQSSRKNSDIVYLVTNSRIYNDIILPYMRDTVVSDKHEALSISDIMLLPDEKSYGYLVISAINISNNEKTQVEAITASGHIMYMNTSSIYLVGNNYNGNSTITKFNIDGMKIGYAGSGNVNGYVLNQFSMDEHNGYFRIATTWNSENNLFILDNSLNICGSVTGLAKGEQIYSVRFMGDKGYIVTYRTIDPLFVFDLSDPKSPKVTGELKIPGFSNYLHPVGDNLILGIGQDTYEIYKKDSTGKEIVVGTRQGGLKLSLFDVSDMGKPTEISNYVLGDSGSYSEALYNHKAVMFDKTNNNVVFDVYITDTSNNWSQGAAVINLDNNNINLKGILEYIQPEVYGNYIPNGRRNLYIGDKIYYIQDGIVSSYDYKTLEKIDTLMLK
ncbi:beta-propeller domain-containing protein [Ruminiclostridium herbifermentans]|uniref:Beta-propeller domain-containing protein n=1 Tax=Ruminiclostridium herbifermentans TaxID=2488810 RepID=A0A4U7JFY4_9FIRM|nr:beta-propeller domain-containing protein [Ruminiclostridium herbifermentans]QNU66561.1 beta-propeller domain-containing protein [Ruminiclostridium herbifermentans]